MAFTAQDARNEGWSTMPAYLDGHCAGFNGLSCKTPGNGVDAQAYDRGYEVGLQARARIALAATELETSL